MSKIKIQNFGPIKEGYLEDDGWIDVKKVTVFIGNQGSGKSTVAKALSTLYWIEKSLNRGDLNKNEFSFNQFKDFLSYQGLQDYFQSGTLIEYIGNSCTIKYNKNNFFPVIEFLAKRFPVPKIMYVPAERNFLSTIEDAFEVRGLPEHLFTFAEELKKAQRNLKGKSLDLPLRSFSYEYDETSESSFIRGKDYMIDLKNASSGLQAVIPLYIVTRYLTNQVLNKKISPKENMSVNQSIRMNEEIAAITLDKKISNELRQRKINIVKAKFINSCFINIVEEPEQNLFPNSQRLILNSLLSFNNRHISNKLLMTTHSPYLINYLTIAVKGHLIKNQFSHESVYDKKSSKYKLSEIVPLKSTIKPEDLAIFEFNEKDGSITKLKDYKGLPSDDNYLNNSLAESNELFAQLLEIQQGL